MEIGIHNAFQQLMAEIRALREEITIKRTKNDNMALTEQEIKMIRILIKQAGTREDQVQELQAEVSAIQDKISAIQDEKK